MHLARRACNWKQGEWVVLFVYNFMAVATRQSKIVKQKYNLVAAVRAKLDNTQQAIKCHVAQATETDDGEYRIGSTSSLQICKIEPSQL